MKPVQEACPKCGKIHTMGEYEHRPDGKVMQPRDVKCDCGLVLHWSVPIFNMTKSGYVLRPLKDNEVPFLSETQKPPV